tara:strand:+ start:4749 stop:5369 length:621 start_codon:yes stop_codon:yes gene_type:complete
MIKEGTFDLFTTPIKVAKSDLDNKLISKYVLDFCKDNEGRLNSQNPKGRLVSNEGGFQSKDIDFEYHKRLKPLYAFLLEQGNNLSDELGFPRVKLDNLWFNINGYKDYNQDHRHAGCIYSGVYYLQTPEKCGDIVFTSPAATELESYWDEHIKNKNNHPRTNIHCTCKAEAGVMYLFPSFLTHGVLPNLNETENRISVAFNFKKML